jgi:hypothetical protein
MTEQSKPVKPVWGAFRIAEIIEKTPRETFHMLSRGQLPARKVGRQMVNHRIGTGEFLARPAASAARGGGPRVEPRAALHRRPVRRRRWPDRKAELEPV